MNDLTVELANSVRQFKPYAKIVRAVYPEVLLDQQGQEHYSQNIQQFLELYDYTLVVPGNYAKDQGIPLIKQMADVAAAAMKLPGAQGKIILEMPTYDAQKKQWLLDDELRHYVSASRDKGITNFGFYPDILKK
jgi:biofilm PGA synthesis lipoprotein PgaB